MARNIAPQDISWFLDLYRRKLLDLNPPYQRHSVWTTKERRYFLDTVLNGYPCPPLFLYKSISDEGVATYHVVDGKQRLETIISFAENKITLSGDMQDEGLAGKKWKTIELDQKKKFWNYQLAVEMLDSVDSAVVKEIFDRYNRTSKNLERQELRHAKYDGWLVTAAEEEAKKLEWRDLGIVTTATARRMKDVQFISELMMILLKENIAGFDQDDLDEHYAKFDTPSEADPSFSEEDFTEKFDLLKNWILALEANGNVVTSFGKSYTNFYSLWGFAASLACLPDPVMFASTYKDFMEKVFLILKAENIEEYASGSNAPIYREALIYAQSARGANTELPQRTARHKALASLLPVEVTSDEN
jgi:hypothetical protein